MAFVKKQSQNVLYGDFETITQDTQYFKKYNDTAVYLWNLKNIDENISEIGVDIGSMLNYLLHEYGKSCIVFFHNLSFDGDFIIKYLIKIGYKWVNELANKVANTFACFKNGNNIYYIETWLYRPRKAPNREKYIKVSFRCSARLLSAGIAQLGEALGFPKGYIDYNVEPCAKVSDYKPEIIEYLERDTTILNLAMKQFFSDLETIRQIPCYAKVGIKNIYTIGGLAYKLQKAAVYNNHGVDFYRGLKISLESYDYATFFMFGGFTQFNPLLQYETTQIPNGESFDINSAHPNSMTKLLPYGEMLDAKPEGQYIEYWEIYIEKATIIYGNFPCLFNWKKRNREDFKSQADYQNLRYVSRMSKFTCYYMRKEFELMHSFYKFEGVKIIKKTYFKAKAFLKEYVEDIYQYKEKYSISKEKAKAYTFKILLNASYGKHATRKEFAEGFICENKTHMQHLLAAGSVDIRRGSKLKTYKVLREPLNKYENTNMLIIYCEDEKHGYYNKWIAATITSYTRMQIFKTLLKCGAENFLYCDTDSLYLANGSHESSIKMHATKLGYWAKESQFDEITIRGAKAYFTSFRGVAVSKTHSGIHLSRAKDMSVEVFKAETYFLALANLKNVFLKSGKCLVWANYTAKPRTN